MPRIVRWSKSPIKDGIQIVTLRTWKYFSEFLDNELSSSWKYLFRGQASSDWPLEPSLHRLLKQVGRDDRIVTREHHLNMFHLAARGRRGPNPPAIGSEDEWWALGQHHGLATPLLDWTESPFAALFFAFEQERKENIPGRYRAVYAFLEMASHVRMPMSSVDEGIEPIYPPRIIRPLSDENTRLVSQRGVLMLVRSPMRVESWVTETYKGQEKVRVLIVIQIPHKGREDCLRFLNQMNINHLSLFPDLQGASEYCNMSLAIENY